MNAAAVAAACVCALILSAAACGESNAVASQAGSTVRMRNASGQSDSQAEAGRKPINNYHSPAAVVGVGNVATISATDQRGMRLHVQRGRMNFAAAI